MIIEEQYMNDLENAEITIIENFFTVEESDYFFEKLEKDIKFN